MSAPAWMVCTIPGCGRSASIFGAEGRRHVPRRSQKCWGHRQAIAPDEHLCPVGDCNNVISREVAVCRKHMSTQSAILK